VASLLLLLLLLLQLIGTRFVGGGVLRTFHDDE